MGALKIITDYIVGEEGWSISRCENFENRVYRIPRKDFYNIEYKLDFAGCYIMIAESNDPKKEFKIYVGSSDIIRNRITSKHDHDSWWDELIIFTADNNKMQHSSATYLEKEVFNWFILRDKQYEFMNKSTPKTSSQIEEIDKHLLDKSFEIFKTIIRSCGYRFFISKIERYIPKSKKNTISESNVISQPKISELVLKNIPEIKLEEIMFHCKIERGSKGCHGKGYVIDSSEKVPKFKVLKGSICSTSCMERFKEVGGTKLRDELINNGTIKKNNNERFEFTTNYIFSSATAAANVIRCSSAEYKNWVDDKGKTLKKYMDNLKK